MNVSSKSFCYIFADGQTQSNAIFVELSKVHDLSELWEQHIYLAIVHSYSRVLHYDLNLFFASVDAALNNNVPHLRVFNCVWN